MRSSFTTCIIVERDFLRFLLHAHKKSVRLNDNNFPFSIASLSSPEITYNRLPRFQGVTKRLITCYSGVLTNILCRITYLYADEPSYQGRTNKLYTPLLSVLALLIISWCAALTGMFLNGLTFAPPVLPLGTNPIGVAVAAPAMRNN